MRFYFDTGLKLTATGRNEDDGDERDGPRCVLTRNPQQIPHPLTAALKGLANLTLGGFKIDTVESHARPTGRLKAGPTGDDHDYIHEAVYHQITMRGTTPFRVARTDKWTRANSEYVIEVVAHSDTFIDGWPEWDWSLHDTLFKEEQLIKEKK